MVIKELVEKKLYKEFIIEVPYSDIDNSINNKINEIIPSITVPGFRKGKAPLSIVRKKHENNVLGDVIENIVQEKTKELLDEKKLKPFRQPKVEIRKYVKDKPVEISISIDIEPDIKLKPFKNFKTNKYEIKIDAKTYNENYKNYIKSQKIFTDVKVNRSIKKGDKVNIDIVSENKEIPEFLRSQKDTQLVTDSDYQILPDISNKLIESGVKIGDKVNLQFDLKEILKKDNKTLVNFSISIKSILEQKEFEINKDFLTKNNFKSEKHFKDQINEIFKNNYNNYLREIEKKELMDILEEDYQFDIPEGIFDEEYKIIWERVQKAKKENQLDEDDKKLTEIKLIERYKAIASRRVKLAILMQKIADTNSININEKELTDGMIAYASQYPGQEKQIYDFFKKNPSKIENIKGPILEKKIVEHILNHSTSKNVSISVNEFKKLQESTFSLKK